MTTLQDAHVTAQARLRLLTTRGVAALWAALPAYDEANVAEWLAWVLPLIDAAQRQAAALVDAYVARALRRPPVGIAPEQVTGAAVRAGTEPAVVYRRPFIATWSALKAGRAWQEAVRTGLGRATSTAAMDVQLTHRAAFQAVQDTDPSIYGYRRVPDADACAFCRAVAGAYVKQATAMPLHNHCGCSLAPLTEPDPRARFLPSGESTAKKYAVREHGELGAVLTDPADRFTSADEI